MNVAREAINPLQFDAIHSSGCSSHSRIWALQKPLIIHLGKKSQLEVCSACEVRIDLDEIRSDQKKEDGSQTGVNTTKNIHVIHGLIGNSCKKARVTCFRHDIVKIQDRNPGFSIISSIWIICFRIRKCRTMNLSDAFFPPIAALMKKCVILPCNEYRN